MSPKKASIYSWLIQGGLLLIVFFTPLIYTSSTHELFEFPKMSFVYTAVTLLLILHLIDKWRHNQALFTRTPLDLAIVFFFLGYLASAILSLDLYTSLFGYYSRFNGGLVSVSVFLIFYYLMCTRGLTDRRLASLMIDILLAAAALVALFGIAQHFGYQKNYWLQDSAARVFSSLGQPNWLAAFLTMLFPLSLGQLLNHSAKKSAGLLFLIISVLIFTAIWFTYSLSGLLGLAIALITFFWLAGREIIRAKIHWLLATLALCFLLAVTQPGIFAPRFNSLFKQLKAEAVGAWAAEATASQPGYEGDTFKIRLIVWQGALNLLKSSPKTLVIGTGPETFAYAFLPYRPAELNLTTEWDFLYNKTHNDYLNILADRGLVGFLTYLWLITTYLISLVKNRTHLTNTNRVWLAALGAGFISLLITNFFGWSVVATTLLFWLFPALSFILISQNRQEAGK